MCVCICHSLQTNEAMTNYPSESVNVNEGKCRFRLLHATLVQLSRQIHAFCACLCVCACVHINKIFETCTHILFYCKLQQLNSSSNSFYCIQFDYIIIFITFITYTHTHARESTIFNIPIIKCAALCPLGVSTTLLRRQRNVACQRRTFHCQHCGNPPHNELSIHQQ